MERQYLRVPSGPPKPMKPAGELYADVLLAAGRQEAAMAAYRQSLDWIPLRTPSMRGLAEEAPGAYKDVSAVVEAADQAGLASLVARLEPMICVKG